MVRRSRRAGRNLRFELIPMIDVFMIITLFLTVMAFLPQISDSLKAELPTSQTAEKTPPSLVVQLSVDGRIHFQEQVVEPTVLQEKLKAAIAEKPDTAVIIAADKSIPYEKVVNLIDQLKISGVKRLALATAPQP
ncbi:MAG TPA: biopolymer transporter ExbD [Stenomitos sp.]